jgi:hypothetical protein
MPQLDQLMAAFVDGLQYLHRVDGQSAGDTDEGVVTFHPLPEQCFQLFPSRNDLGRRQCVDHFDLPFRTPGAPQHAFHANPGAGQPVQTNSSS